MTSVGEVIGSRYQVVGKLGSGGMAVVWLVIDLNTYKMRALRELRADIELTTRTQLIETARYGTNIMSCLDYPLLQRVLDIKDDGESFYAVVEFVEGKTLDFILRERSSAFTEKEVIDWGMQLCKALQFLHDKGILYRDMKPKSVMLTHEGKLKLIGVWLAIEYGRNDYGDLLPMGTMGYASPEHYKSVAALSPESDIYSLGATLFHLATGKAPLEFADSPVLPSARSINTKLSKGLEAIVAKATRLDPAERYLSCDEMCHDLEAVGKDGEVSLHASSLRTLLAKALREIRDR